MQTTSDSPPPKRARAKTKSAAAQPTITLKKRTAKTPAPAEPAPSTAVEAKETEENVSEINGMIATAAYFLAEERGFAPGHELEDWLEAERRIKVLCFG
jgi:hypothetical protein